MKITDATSADVNQAVSCLADAFARDPITGFLLQQGEGYRERLTWFFSLLMRARIALAAPVFLARQEARIVGASMGYSTARPDWPADLSEEWERFEKSIPGIADRMAVYDGVANEFKPAQPHYYLGVIGAAPALQGQGIGSRLMESFCKTSADDPRSAGVYLETAQESNLKFYERAGFVETGRGNLGSGTLWCMFRKTSQ